MTRCQVPGRIWCQQAEPCKAACLLYQDEFVVNVVKEVASIGGNPVAATLARVLSFDKELGVVTLAAIESAIEESQKQAEKLAGADVRHVLKLLADEEITVAKAKEWIYDFVMMDQRGPLPSGVAK